MPIALPDPATMNDLTDKEKSAIAGMQHYNDWDSGYSKQQSTRPQTVSYGLTDSPAGQLTWILEKFWSWTDSDGHPENALTRDELLDNVMLYWLPANAASSARLYFGGRVGFVAEPFFAAKITTPARQVCQFLFNLTCVTVRLSTLRTSAFAHIRHDTRDPSFVRRAYRAGCCRRTGRISSKICAPHDRFVRRR